MLPGGKISDYLNGKGTRDQRSKAFANDPAQDLKSRSELEWGSPENQTNVKATASVRALPAHPSQEFKKL